MTSAPHLRWTESVMEHWMEGVRRILARAPTGTLAFSEILDELAREGMGESPGPRWLLRAVCERKDLFRVIPFLRGPWAHWRAQVQGSGDPLHQGLGSDDPWVLLLRAPVTGNGSAESAMGRIRDGLRAWGQDLDEASPASVSRWIRANREGSRAWRALFNGRSWKA